MTTPAKPTYEQLEAQLSRLREALEKIVNGRFHIGNDANGNVFGPPDSVMCRNIAKAALTPASEPEEKP